MTRFSQHMLSAILMCSFFPYGLTLYGAAATEPTLSPYSSSRDLIENSDVIEPTEEGEKIAQLIHITELSLENLKKLQTALCSFKEQETVCVHTPSTYAGNDGLYELSKRAYTLIQLIQQTELSPYFKKDFLDELDMISKAYRAKALPSIRLESNS